MISRRQLLSVSGALMGVIWMDCDLQIANARSQQRAVFRMPEESARHTRTFMQWPVNRVVHPDATFLKDLQQAIADIANTVAQFEPVVMLMHRDFAASTRRKLAENVDIWDIPTDYLWCRDPGPVFVTDDDGCLAVTHLHFNGWGGRQVHGNDGKVARRVAQRLELPVHDNGLVGGRCRI